MIGIGNGGSGVIASTRSDAVGVGLSAANAIEEVYEYAFDSGHGWLVLGGCQSFGDYLRGWRQGGVVLVGGGWCGNDELRARPAEMGGMGGWEPAMSFQGWLLGITVSRLDWRACGCT